MARVLYFSLKYFIYTGKADDDSNRHERSSPPFWRLAYLIGPATISSAPDIVCLNFHGVSQVLVLLVHSTTVETLASLLVTDCSSTPFEIPALSVLLSPQI